MKLKSVKIENFRAIKDLELPLHPQLTVFIGDNAAGKTTILDAIAHALSPIPFYLIREPENDSSRQFYKYFRLENFRITDHANQLFSGKCCITLRLSEEINFQDHAGKSFSFVDWQYKRIQGDNEPEFYALEKLHRYITVLFYRVTTENPDINIPVITYYDNKRGNFYLPPEAWERNQHEANTHPRFLAMQNTLGGTPRFWGVFDWFLDQEDMERREREEQRSWDYKLPLLEVVRQAICRMIPNASNPRIEIKPKKQFFLDFETAQDKLETLSLVQLSDGYRTLLSIVIDLARRMAQANPHLDNPIESEAIVLIDEVDLHLHPRWQQTVLPDLMRTFPNAQFIVTTHSPQVLTSVHKENIRLLECCEEHGICVYPPITEPYGAESSDALHSIMHVNPRPQDLEEVKKYNRYMQLVNHGDYDTEEALALRAHLETVLGRDQFNLADMLIRKHKVLGV